MIFGAQSTLWVKKWLRENILGRVKLPIVSKALFQCNLIHVIALFKTNCLHIWEKKKPFTYSDILVEHFNDDGGRVDSNFIDVSPQNQVLEDQHLIPGRTPCLPDHTRVSNKMCKDNTTKGICDQNKVMPWELYINNIFVMTENYFNVIGWEQADYRQFLICNVGRINVPALAKILSYILNEKSYESWRN